MQNNPSHKSGTGQGGQTGAEWQNAKFVKRFEMAIMQFAILGKARQQGGVTRENLQQTFRGGLRMSSDHFDHCLRELVADGHLKEEGNKYVVTDDGREDVEKVQHLVVELPAIVGEQGSVGQKQGMTATKTAGGNVGGGNVGSGNVGSGNVGGGNVGGSNVGGSGAGKTGQGYVGGGGSSQGSMGPGNQGSTMRDAPGNRDGQTSGNAGNFGSSQRSPVGESVDSLNRGDVIKGGATNPGMKGENLQQGTKTGSQGGQGRSGRIEESDR